MQVKTLRTIYETATLQAGEVQRIARTHLKKALDIPDGAFIRDGKLFESWEVGAGSHSWTEEKEVREAAEMDIAALKVLAKL